MYVSKESVTPKLWVRLKCFIQAYRDHGVLHFKIESELTGTILKQIEENHEIMLEWFSPHEGPSYHVGTDVMILTEPDDFEFVKESFDLV